MNIKPKNSISSLSHIVVREVIINKIRYLFKPDFTTDHFISGGASYQHIPGEHSVAFGTRSLLCCKIFSNTLFETFNQRAFPTFFIFKKLLLAFIAINIHTSGGSFSIWFCYKSPLTFTGILSTRTLSFTEPFRLYLPFADRRIVVLVFK